MTFVCTVIHADSDKLLQHKEWTKNLNASNQYFEKQSLCFEKKNTNVETQMNSLFTKHQECEEVLGVKRCKKMQDLETIIFSFLC